MYELTIENNGVIYKPLIEGEIKLTLNRKGSPGKLEFNVLKDNIINFQEGNVVRFKVDNENMFFGFVWDKSRNKDQSIKVTAYDQLRYLKFKDTYIYQNKKASDLIKMIANDQNLKVGDIEDTGYVITERYRSDETLFDIIYDALGLTLDNRNKLYVLYDDFGRLTLKNIASMQENIIVGYNTAEGFEYKTSLDNVYNQIKLQYPNEKTGKLDTYVVKDSANINKWGKLQYYEQIDENTNGQAKAEALIQLYNQKNRSLSIKNALGDKRVKGGTSLVVNLPEVADISIQNYMIVNQVVHKFTNDSHFMNLTLRGQI